MGRVAAFLQAGNEHRTVSVGGRSRNNMVWATLNTDNAFNSDCSLSAQANVSSAGNSKFTIELPADAIHNCSVLIRETKQIKIDEFLDAVKNQCDIRDASTKIGANSIEAAKTIIENLRGKYDNLPNIVLPGNVKLDYAMACVRIVEELLA